MELDIITQVVCKETDLFVEDGTQFLRRMDVKRCRTSHQSEGGDHAYQSEAVVAVQMGDKDVTQFRESHMTAPELHLRTLRTVEHKKFFAHLHNL